MRFRAASNLATWPAATTPNNPDNLAHRCQALYSPGRVGVLGRDAWTMGLPFVEARTHDLLFEGLEHLFGDVLKGCRPTEIGSPA